MQTMNYCGKPAQFSMGQKGIGVLTLLSALALPPFAWAQTNPKVPDVIDRAFVEQLLQRLDTQEAQIKELKSKMAAAPPASAEAMPAMPAVPQSTFPTIEFHGFGDADYRVSDRQNDKNTFALGQFDLFLTSQLAENLGVLSEVVLEANDHNQFGIELERLLLQYHPSDYFNADIGRYHTSVGYYNTAYHHGTWFQTAVGRPSFLDFEDGGGIIPAHNVGISIHGAIPSGSFGLNYVAEVGNGRAYQRPGTEDNLVLNVQDDNDYKAFNLALIARPEWLPGLQFGAGVYHDTLTPQGLPRTDETMLHGHFVYKNSLWEFLSEGYLIRHKPVEGSEHYTSAFFAQVARKFGAFTPYARFSYLNASQNDAIYTSILENGGVHYGPGLGIRYDFSTYAALKAQYDHSIDTGEKSSNEFTLQAAFTF